MKFLTNIGRRLLEPSTLAGAGGAPIAAVIGTAMFPQFAIPIQLGAAVLGGALIGRKEKKTLRKEGFIKIQ